MEIDREQMHRRTVWLIFGLAAWALVISAFLANFCIIDRNTYREESRKLAWRTGIYPALRGQIISENGTPLAWCEKKYTLVLVRMLALSKNDDLVRELNLIYPSPYPVLTQVQIPHTLCTGLNPEQVEKAIELQKRFPEVQIQSQVARIVRDIPALRAMVGEVSWSGGRMVGVSGLEKEYDHMLAGKDGIYKVMVTRHGQWIPGSWQMVTPPENGCDVRLGNLPIKKEVVP